MRILRYLFISIFLFSFRFSSASSEQIGKNLTVCSESGFIPFEMKDNAGNWTGFDIDLIKKFADDNNLNLVMIDVSLDGIIPALTTKKCDLIASGLTMTEERAKFVLFSKPVYSVVISAAFLNSEETKNKFKQFNDIDKPNIKIASQTGSAASNFLKKIITKATLMQYSTENDELNALLQKRADLLVEDNVFISQVEKKLNKQFYVLASTEKGDLAFAARKEDATLIAKLNSFIDKIMKDGTYRTVKEKYFGM